MLLRLLILAVVVVLVYRAAKKWFGTGQHSASGNSARTPETVDDEMILDPECGVYFPQRDAVSLTEGNQVYYFCSNACRDRYLARHSDEASE